jgi:hypothetical protein
VGFICLGGEDEMNWRRLLQILFCTASCYALISTTNATGSWVLESLDSTGDVGLYTSIAVDSQDKVHISYYDSTDDDLKYITNATGSWVVETLDSIGIFSSNTSIAVDSQDKVHISYYDSTNLDLKYITNATGSWVAETLDSTGDVGGYTFLAVDSQDKVHISYYDRTNLDLKYITNATGSWVAETLDSTGYVGSSTSLAFDAQDKVHISYYDSTDHDLKYITNATGSWVAETLDSPLYGLAGSHTSIAVDSQDRVHISYHRWRGYPSISTLKYATNATGSWVAKTLDSLEEVGEYTSIAVDSQDKVHISYYDLTNDDLKYAWCDVDCADTTNWNAETLDTIGMVGEFTSLTIDSQDWVHISYHDDTNGDLKYAKQCFGMDSDCDGALDYEDNCPNDYNPAQEDTDQDGVGDVCDPDHDNDGICDPGESDPSCTDSDNCPLNYNPEQEDMDTDNIGDICDNCPTTSNGPLLGTCTWSEMITCTTINDCAGGGSCNMNQEDSDADNMGDVCDECTDTDGDGYGDPEFLATTCILDNCPNNYNSDQMDVDEDTLGDVCDNCPEDANPGQEDEGDSDGIGDVCDNCPNDYNSDQIDLDEDGLGDACDNCPLDYNPEQEDMDTDYTGDICDNCQYDNNPDQTDIDEDGIGDECDICPNDAENDIDADGLCGDIDNCPYTPNGTDLGTCIWGEHVGLPCTLAGYNPMQCGTDGFCSMNQEDIYPPQGNDIGDACDCECDFDCSGGVDANDVTAFLGDFGRSTFNNPCTNADPCNGDVDCNVNVDANDVNKFLEDFGRSQFNNPCPACSVGNWCVY